MENTFIITKSDGTRQPFDKEKLISSLRRVGTSQNMIKSIVDQIILEKKDNMTTSEIYSHAFALLREHSAPTAIKYSIRRAMLELGPDGFPFEKFVARIFKMWGYEAVTDQTIMGSCVEHEVDVVAWNKDSLAMAEAKFHNVFGMKSDLKVALYVKARYDDLAQNLFDYGGIKRKLTERWLITNTKFTDKAIRYSECNKIKLIGWNYPTKNGLHEIIEQNGLHPITCVSGLTHQEKKYLTERNVLVCIDIVGNPKVLEEIGVKTDRVENILTEAQLIIEQAK
jgi:hypothetical protein